MNTPKFNLLVISNHPLICYSFKNLLDRQDYIYKVWTAQNSKSALMQAQNHPLDLVFLDTFSSSVRSTQLIQQLRDLHPQVRLILLTLAGQSLIFRKATQLNVDGFLLKHSAPGEILTATEAILLKHKKVVAPRLRKQARFLEMLRPRELEVMLLLCQELSSKEIAERLFISVHTVKNHRAAITRKIGCKNLAGIYKWAVQNELIALDSKPEGEGTE